MCGICGIYKYGNPNHAFDEALLVRMSDVIKHRGPDDAGTFLSSDHRVGFGFRRLSIVDLSPAGHQPMFTPDKSVAIVFNGEIYNHLVIRKELEAKGYKYRSRSDTETILYAYQEYGLNFVHKLLGMFALALWDEKRRILVLARDRIGIKPLYYTVADGQLIFGSEIKAILQHPSVSREIDPQAMDAYLTFLISPAPLTMFKNIRKLEPGHFLVIGQDGIQRDEQYWDPVPSGEQPSIDIDGTPIPHSTLVENAAGMTEESCISTIRTLLKQSVKDRMMSDVPFGVFLSGGIDSSTNVALMAELMDRPVDTFSVGVRDLEKYNELGYARQIASQFKTNHHEVMIDQRMAFDFLPKLIYHQDEPLADPVCIPLYFVSKLARDNGTIVVQVGEGSDEQFAGYQSMLRELRFYNTAWKAYKALPGFAQSSIYGAAALFLKRKQEYLALDYIRKGLKGEELFWGGAINFTETHKRLLLDGGRKTDPQFVHALAKGWHDELLRKDPGADYLKRMIYLEFKNRLPELLLMRVDKVSMAASIEARVPFLDHRLVEYSMTIPQEFKIKGGEPKYILKKAVEGIIPDNIIYRKKQGFAAPVNEWLRNEWSGYAENAIRESALVKQGILQYGFIKSMIESHRARKIDAGQNIWNLLNLVLWHKYWIEGKEL
ncbi:MAG: asparagine synthase (glutamine-hydrolyzing) [Ignavibacteriales bacterium]|nr:asparagine synthase (glutamine-hydrolyzing) [Ignavibacteriales bacterium]